jgi:hypothetical protein
MATVHHTLVDRTVTAETGCIEWTAARNASGYGVTWNGQKTVLAHRYSYQLSVGPIPDGMHILHRCDNPPCINPDHLFPGDDNDNVVDMIAKGRNNIGQKNGSTKLTDEQVVAIRSDARTQRVIAKEYGISQSQVSWIKSGRGWKHM